MGKSKGIPLNFPQIFLFFRFSLTADNIRLSFSKETVLYGLYFILFIVYLCQEFFKQ